MKLIPVILCGGAGSRLWPVSRELHPKPFIKLTDGESLLQKAWLRAAKLPEVMEILTVTNRELFFKTKDEYFEVSDQAVNSPPNRYILEPCARNTAAAIAAAALQIQELHGDDALMLVLAADHLISDRLAFSQAVAKAICLAVEGRIVTFGIRPNIPETGYGYIESEGNHVVRFIEKPSLEKAQEYVAKGNFLWNSGIFCFSAGTMLREMAVHCSTILDLTRDCIARSLKSGGINFSLVELNADIFSNLDGESIDYAVMEKSNNIAVVPCEIGWSDIGSWSALGNLVEPDAKGNRIEGNALLFGASNCYIRSDKRIVGAVGVSNLIVIDTPDALLVADVDCTQDVRHVYAKLKSEGHEAHKIHRTVFRPWGTYAVIEEGPRFKIKRIEVKPGASLSLQMHHHRSEHWIVVSGTAKVVNGEQVLLVNTNESTYIPAGHQHRLENPGVSTLIMIEVQSGDYLGEDDIVRFEDKYGRV